MGEWGLWGLKGDGKIRCGVYVGLTVGGDVKWGIYG